MAKEFLPQPKPTSTKKKSSKGTTKTVNTAVVDEKVRERNNRNRTFGKGVERKVADLTGGDRVIASGAIKTSVWNLVGDVQVRDADGKRVVVLIECKGTSGITPKGDKTFILKKSVLDQATAEAKQVGALAAVWIHYKDNQYENDYIAIPANQFVQYVEALKVVHKIDEVVNDSSPAADA